MGERSTMAVDPLLMFMQRINDRHEARAALERCHPTERALRRGVAASCRWLGSWLLRAADRVEDPR